MSPNNCLKIIYLSSLVAVLLGGVKLSASAPDRLKPLEKLEAKRIADSIGDQILAFEKPEGIHRLARATSTKRDYLRACSVALGNDGKTGRNERLLRLTAESAVDDPAIRRITAEMETQHEYDAFRVAAWPIYDLPRKRIWIVLVRMYDSKSTVEESLQTSSACQ